MRPSITRTTPDTIDHLAQQAPDALAVIDEDRPISRARLRRELDCMAAALHSLGVAQGTHVALACEHGYVHWLLVLACERLGAVSDAVLDLQPRSLGHAAPARRTCCSRTCPVARHPWPA
jgi:non-ribosomal peptide synthetase component E (peptide arylation enzyme)